MSSSGAVVCPKLEELDIEYWETLEINDMIGMAASRALRGAKIKSVKISCCDGPAYARLNVLEFKKHVLHLEVQYCGNYAGYDDQERGIL